MPIFKKNTLLVEKILQNVCRYKNNAYLCTRNTTTGCSAVRLAHLVWDQRVPGSNPGTPTEKTIERLSSFFVPTNTTLLV